MHARFDFHTCIDLYRSGCLRAISFLRHFSTATFLLIPFKSVFQCVSSASKEQEQSLSVANLVTVNSQTIVKACVTSWIKCLLHILKVINSNPVNSLPLLNVS